ncbi:MAG: glycosyltransferase [Actinobacteria bacterium]|nr:glycosyltransferase [Actinomycetota bacterium]
MISAVELFLISVGLTYYLATTGTGMVLVHRSGWAGRHRHRRGHPPCPAAPDVPAHRRVRPPPHQRLWRLLVTPEAPPPRASIVESPADLVTYFLVPCLNEELVIGHTVRGLLGDSRAEVIVIDDGSDDATGEVAAAVDPDRVRVVRRELPNARLGKGPALNTGFAAILHDAAIRGIAVSRIIVCVMDADGELSHGSLYEVLPLFSDARVGGVQLPVRIRNAHSLLTMLQDLEFWGVAAVGQIGRNVTGTVSLGGNGQFTRLTALLELGREPWRPRLTEDLDLGVALSVAGWRLLSTPRAYVTQQGVPSFRALIRQRTRWYQGHLEAAEWLGKLWSSSRVSHLGMIEITLYLMIPWVLVLPWSVLMNYNLAMAAGWWLGWAPGPQIGATPIERIASISGWYLMSFLPLWSAGYLYHKQRRGSLLLSLLLGNLLLFGNYIAFLACWLGFFRHLKGSRGWAKTSRVSERGGAIRPAVPVADSAPALIGGVPGVAPAAALAPLPATGAESQ